MIVAVGSTRGPKVVAVRRALGFLRKRFPRFLPGEIQLIARSVPSGTSSTPRSTPELTAGARHRARTLFKVLSSEGTVPALSLGLEGGVLSESGIEGNQNTFLLEGWAYATDGELGFFGSSGCLPLPDQLAEAVVARGQELGSASDELYRQADIAGRQGTFGVLTGDIITREEAFVRALIHALAPFYNSKAYTRRFERDVR